MTSDRRANLIGREAELTRVFDLLHPLPTTGRTLLILGEVGVGKSVLLDAAVGWAGSAGMRVLRVVGSRAEADLAFAGLNQLLRPVLSAAGELPPRQRAALLGVFGLDPTPREPAQADPAATEPVPAGRLLIGLAALTLLSDVASGAPLLLVVDDAQWIDPGSLEVLAFIARRLDSEPIIMLVAARGDVPPAELDGAFPRLPVPPLDEAAAYRLLDQQPHPPEGLVRVQVMRQAAGNPLALVELARAAAEDSGTVRTQPSQPTPLTARLRRVFAADYAELPERTRQLLLLAAADGIGEVSRVLAAGGDADRDGAALAPAERTGLIEITGERIRFRHPLVRSAIYQAVPLTERRAAHRALADAYADEPDRGAWHRAAASAGPDERVAAALEATADAARLRSGYAAAARALERAAQLSPDRAQRARRLSQASFMAMFTNQMTWAGRLAEQAAELADDPVLRARARLRTTIGHLAANRTAAALATAVPIVAEMAPLDQAVAATALHVSAEAAYLCGDQRWRRQVLELLAATAGECSANLDQPEDSDRLWAVAALDPFGSRARVLADLERASAAEARHDALQFYELGGAAAFVDHTELAVQHFEAALRLARGSGALLPTWSILVELGWPLIQQGRWAEARMVAAEGLTLESDGGAQLNGMHARLVEATMLALRGETGPAREHARGVLAEIDPRQSRLLAVRAWWAMGAAAVADGDHESAYEQFRMMFTADGDPVHFHASYYGLAELAAAAVRAGRVGDARAVVDRATSTLPDDGVSTRLELQLARCRALLADSDEAEEHFKRALADPAGERWPFERAQALLDHGEWLRRRRRAVDARTGLTTALATFRRLGARPWIERAEAELRASGVSISPVEPDAFGELTPQQQQIIRLAAQGLTNREIGERLYLSPRTVGSHLYRTFPRLGVTTRAQLRDLLARAGNRPPPRSSPPPPPPPRPQ